MRRDCKTGTRAFLSAAGGLSRTCGAAVRGAGKRHLARTGSRGAGAIHRPPFPNLRLKRCAARIAGGLILGDRTAPAGNCGFGPVWCRPAAVDGRDQRSLLHCCTGRAAGAPVDTAFQANRIRPDTTAAFAQPCFSANSAAMATRPIPAVSQMADRPQAFNAAPNTRGAAACAIRAGALSHPMRWP